MIPHGSLRSILEHTLLSALESKDANEYKNQPNTYYLQPTVIYHSGYIGIYICVYIIDRRDVQQHPTPLPTDHLNSQTKLTMTLTPKGASLKKG
jgi:hypothetical protein